MLCFFFTPLNRTTSSFLEEIYEGWLNLNSQKITFAYFTNYVRINVIYDDADLEGKVIENKHATKLNMKLHNRQFLGCTD